MTATITQEATHQLRLAPGDEVLALCKATAVQVAPDPASPAGNSMAGVVRILAEAKALGLTLGPDLLEATTLDIVAYGKSCTGMDFVRGNNAYQAAAVAIAQFMARYDVILSPTLSAPPLTATTRGRAAPGAAPNKPCCAWAAVSAI